MPKKKKTNALLKKLLKSFEKQPDLETCCRKKIGKLLNKKPFNSIKDSRKKLNN